MATHRAADQACRVTIIYSKPMEYLDRGTMQKLKTNGYIVELSAKLCPMVRFCETHTFGPNWANGSFYRSNALVVLE
jgi:hypothetical protein